MKAVKKAGVIIILLAVGYCTMALKAGNSAYRAYYLERINALDSSLLYLQKVAATAKYPSDITTVRDQLAKTRLQMKRADIWLRYLEPLKYKRINGPLAVEWENEVFEKYEKPYRRNGAGLTLAEQYLDGKNINRDTLIALITPAIEVLSTFRADSITEELLRPGNLLLCNRLYLLNLATIYTTGFDCPDKAKVIPELRYMMREVRAMYDVYNQDYPSLALSDAYLALYDRAITFVNEQDGDYTKFDHFTFIKTYINPLFALNQAMIRKYNVASKSYNDYTLNDEANSIFDKKLYTAQNVKGIFSFVENEKILAQIADAGKLLFYDPILSGNNERSCASCHKPEQYFTDTTVATSEAFDHKGRLERNTPSLINVVYGHLLMLDGRHTTLHAQARDVMTNAHEMGGDNAALLEKVMSCKDYRVAFNKLLQSTPEEKTVTIEHIVSALTIYYSQFSNYYAPFDDAMNKDTSLDGHAVKGFNLFMGKAKCGTCHYVPTFAGVPAPYINSEFEVVGTPADTGYKALSTDRGRYAVNAAYEMDGAFRVTTVRNAVHTKPYMHNGVFTSLEQLIDFYDGGGGAGHGLNVPNQTLESDSLKLSKTEKRDLIAFIHSLDERIIFDKAPERLPRSSQEALNKRQVGGKY